MQVHTLGNHYIAQSTTFCSCFLEGSLKAAPAEACRKPHAYYGLRKESLITAMVSTGHICGLFFLWLFIILSTGLKQTSQDILEDGRPTAHSREETNVLILSFLSLPVPHQSCDNRQHIKPMANISVPYSTTQFKHLSIHLVSNILKYRAS